MFCKSYRLRLERLEIVVAYMKKWRLCPICNHDGSRWQVRYKAVFDMPLRYKLKHPDNGWFSDPFSAVLDAGEWLERNESSDND